MTTQRWGTSQFLTLGHTFERWIAADATDPNADGSRENPYNEQSAGQMNYDSALHQAVAMLEFDQNQLPAVHDSVQLAVRVMPGAYPLNADVIMPGNDIWGIIPEGLVTFGDGDPYDLIIVPGVDPNGNVHIYTMGLDAETPMVWNGDIQTGDGGAEVDYILNFARFRLTGDLVEEAGGMATSPDLYARDSVFVGTCVLTGAVNATGGWREARNTIFGCVFTVDRSTLFDRCEFHGDITFVDAGAAPIAWLDCVFDEAIVNFSGVAGTAQFDRKTQISYEAAGIAMAGGASCLDYLEPEEVVLLIDTVQDLTDTASNDWDSATPWPCRTMELWTFTDSVPVSAGTVLLTAAADGNNMLAAANYDMETQVGSTVNRPALTATIADRILAQGVLVLLTSTQSGALGGTGTDQRVAVVVRRLRGAAL